MTVTPIAHWTARDLVDGLPARRYLFVEHILDAGVRTPLRCHRDDHRTFLVIEGTVRLEFLDVDGDTVSWSRGRWTGWHARPGSVYRVLNTGDQSAVLLEAGTVAGEVVEADQPAAFASVAVRPCADLSGYTVRKPWGHEIWYTQDLDQPGYALKQIHMVAGHQSSLQSHQRKTETNYIIDGAATVLNGVLAPRDVTATVDVTRLPRAVHGPRTGWSSAVDVLHRVIAESDYTSVEVSTPELDDVIRWADDTGRAHGRIDTEHAGGPA
jgi:mannose-6-phosphate isomerase-like protein (cupin superfamily)